MHHCSQFNFIIIAGATGATLMSYSTESILFIYRTLTLDEQFLHECKPPSPSPTGKPPLA